jgi:hypothetical protein
MMHSSACNYCLCCRDWTEKESSRLAELFKGCTRDSTNAQYGPYQNAYEVR